MVDAVLDDYRTAPISEGLRSTVRFLDALATGPVAGVSAEIEGARGVGVSDDALADAANVFAAFTILNKLADAFGWEPLSEATYRDRAGSSLERGYFVPEELLN